MHILREMLGRELAMLVVLAGLGAGPAALLSSRFGAVERVALAPILGLCVGTSVFTTLLYVWPASSTSWLVPVLVIASVAVAVVRTGRTAAWNAIRQTRTGWLSLLVVAIVVSAPTIDAFHSRHTVGPVSYAVGDAVGYVAEADAEVHNSLHDVVRSSAPATNLETQFLRRYAKSYQNLDAAPLSADVNDLLGLGSTDTWAAYLLAFLVAGALGAVAAVRYALRSRPGMAATAAGAAAGVLFAGPFFMQLLFAGSQAALCGLCVLLPLGAVAADAWKDPCPATLVLTALLLSGLLALYPLFVPAVACAAGAALLFAVWRRLRARERDWNAALRRGAFQLGVVLLLAVLFNVVAFTRDVRYWHAILSGSIYASLSLPSYDMAGDAVAGWLFQTQNLFKLGSLANANPALLGEELLLPLLLGGVILGGVRKFRVVGWLLVAVAAALLFGEYEAASKHCSYCTDRNLLPIAPILIGLLAVGLAVLWMSRNTGARILGVAALVLLLISSAKALDDVRQRVVNTGSYLDSASRSVLSHLPAGSGPVEVEGFDASPAFAPTELPFAYELAEERAWNRASLPGDVNNYLAMAYLGVFPIRQGQFDPDYRYVLTRLPGVATSRRVLARSGGIALEQRTQPLDVTVDGGLAAPSPTLDPEGVAWATTGPMRFLVTGGAGSPAYVRARFIASVPVTVPPQRGVTSRLDGTHLTVCARAVGTAPIRNASVRLAFTPVPLVEASEPSIGAGVRLASMAATTRRCR